MSQQNIDFGSFPNDPSADAIRTAFQKVQDNFTQLFTGLEQQAVLSVNQTPGAGISVNAPTGNVVVSANIACVQISTTTLSVGTGSNNSSNAGGTAVITSSSQVAIVDLPANIAGVNNISISGTLTANSIVSNSSVSFPSLSLSGNLVANTVTSNTTLTVTCLLYTSPSPRDRTRSRMPSSA